MKQFHRKLSKGTTLNGGLTIVHSQGEKVLVKEKELQKQKVLKAFANEPKTMKMVQVETGIERTNFTALLNSMYNNGAIYKPYCGKCPYGRNGVGYYTTNPDYVTESNQLKLFNDEAA